MLAQAVEGSASAVLVQPYDEKTAEDLWREHFQCRLQRPGWVMPNGEVGAYLWHSVGTPNQDWG